MSHVSILSIREKIFGAFLVAFLIVIGGVSYTYASQAQTLIVQEDTQNQQNHIINMQRWTKDKRREVEQIKKDTKNAVDISKVDGMITTYESCLTKLQGSVGTGDFWNLNQDCDTRSIDDEFNDVLYPARDCANTKRSIEDRRKEKKNIERQVKDILRNDKAADISGLNNFIGQIDAQIAKADQAVPTGGVCGRDQRDALNDVQNDLNFLFQDFYNAANELQQKSNDVRQVQEGKKDFESNIKRGCEKDKSRRVKEIEKDIGRLQKTGALTEEAQANFTQIKSLYDQMCVQMLGTMQQALDSGDVNLFNDIRNEFWTLDRDFWDTTNESGQKVQEEQQKVQQLKNVNRDLKQKSRDLARMKKDLARIKKVYDRAAKKYANREDRKEALAALSGFVGQAGELIKKIEESVQAAQTEAATDPDSYWFDRQQELNDLQNEFSELQNSVQNIGNLIQSTKDIERSIKNYQKERTSLGKESKNDPELMGKLKDTLDQMQALQKEIWSTGIADPDEGMALVQQFWDLNQDWNDAVNDWRGNYYDYEEEGGYGPSPSSFGPPPAPVPELPPPPAPASGIPTSGIYLQAK